MSISPPPVRVRGERPATGPASKQEDVQMKQYMLSVYHPEQPEHAPSPETMEQIFHDVDSLNEGSSNTSSTNSGGGKRPDQADR
jgi:hypothetical protein